jgi:hypothetical protein
VAPPRVQTEAAYGGVPAGLAGLGYEARSGDFTTGRTALVMVGGPSAVDESGRLACQDVNKRTLEPCKAPPAKDTGLCVGHLRAKEKRERAKGS